MNPTTREPSRPTETPVAPKPVVFLVHGLHMRPVVMWPLARRLRRAGYPVQLFGHASVTGSLDATAARLAEAIERRGAQRVVLVGHSLGGLVAAHTVKRYPELPVRDVVLLGSPYQGSGAAESFSRTPGLGLLLGRPLAQWIRLQDRSPAPHVRFRTVAGTRAAGLGRLVKRFEVPNDGTVALTETVLPGAVDSCVLPVSHSGMLFSEDVARQLLGWLQQDAAAG